MEPPTTHHRPAFYAFCCLAAWVMLMGSCLKSTEPGLPDEVVKVIDETGFNRVQLTKTIGSFLDPADSLKLEASYFLIGNMLRQYSLDTKLTDSLGKEFIYNPLTICEADSFLVFWEKMEAVKGPVKYRSQRFTSDRDTITAEFLTATILQSLNTRSLPWTQTYNKEQLFSYVLPYRVGNEHIDDWRFLLNDYFLEKIPAEMHHSPDAVAHFVNDYINKTFKFDIRFIKQARVQSPAEMFETKVGNYQDISYLKVKALRSLGIPATLDYIPYFADSLYSYYFAAYINANGTFEMLPHEGHAQLFQQSRHIPKVYRRVFEELKTGLFALKDSRLTTPPFLGHFPYLDVTAEYIPVKEVHFQGDCHDSLLYLTVFNDKKWRAVDWALCKDNKAVFRNVSTQIQYQFAILADSNAQLSPVAASLNGSK